MRKTQLLLSLCILSAGLAGCATKKIVLATPPSVSTPPPQDASPMPSPETPPPVNATEEPAPEVPSPAPPPSLAKRPAAPKRPGPCPIFRHQKRRSFFTSGAPRSPLS